MGASFFMYYYLILLYTPNNHLLTGRKILHINAARRLGKVLRQRLMPFADMI